MIPVPPITKTLPTSTMIPALKVPNLKFVSPNKDGRYSEICANCYTGKSCDDRTANYMGTFNFLCRDAPHAMVHGKLPTTGEHHLLGIIPHKKYGGGVDRHNAAGIEVGSIEKGPVLFLAIWRKRGERRRELSRYLEWSDVLRKSLERFVF